MTYKGYKLLIIMLFSTALTAQYKGQLSGNTETLWDIHTAPDGTHYIPGNKGIILRQDTGCTGWDQQSTGATNGVRGIWFTNDSTGYACGTSGTLFKTTNRGDHWSPLVSGTTIGLLDIEFITDSIGYTVGGGSGGFRILRTTDAGLSWSTVDSTLTHSPFDLTFVDQNTGYLAGVGGMIMKTVDGGLNWTVLVGGVTGNTTWTAIHFTDAQTGYVAGQGGNISKTTDGGTTWTSLSSGTTQFLNGLHFKNNTTGYFVGNSGTLLTTTDAGASFQAVNFTHRSAFRGIALENDEVLICGSDGLIFQYDTAFAYESVWYEDFCNVNDSISMGNGWTIIHGSGTTESWRFDNPNAGNALNFVMDAPFASFDSQHIGSSDQDSCILESPEFDVSDFTQLSLQWNEAFLPNFMGEVFTTIQGWDGSQWITLYSSNGGYNSSSSGSITYTASYSSTSDYRRAIDISALAGERDAKLRFIYHDLNPSFRFWWGIDDIEVRAGKTDLRLDSIISPTDICQNPVGDTVKVHVTNASDFGVFPIQLAYQYDTNAVLYRYFVATLAPGADTVLSLGRPLPVSSSATPTLKVWLHENIDADLLNDTLSINYQPLTGQVDLGPDTSLCIGESFTLRAGFPGADTYQWTGGNSTNDSLTVTASGVYSVLVTKNGCTLTDTVEVTFSSPTGSINASLDTFSISGNTVFNINTTASSIQWDFGPGATPATASGAGPHTVSFNASGTKTVKVILEEGGCVDSLNYEVFVAPGVDLNEHILSGVNLYPNPGKGAYSLELPAGSGVTHGFVLTLNGAVVQEFGLSNTTFHQFHLDAPKGVYMLRLLGGETDLNIRLVKN